MNRDLRTGTPIKRVAVFCVPLLIGNLFQQVYNMTDSVVVSNTLGTGAFAAVGSTGALNFLILGFVMGICSGFSIPVAQCYGAGDLPAMRKHVANCVYFGIAVTASLTLLTAFFTDDILRLLNTPPEYMDNAYKYIFVIFMGMASIMLYNLLACILRALGESRTPLLFLVISCVLNVGLDLLFIPVFKMGVEGAAYATVIAQTVSGLLCILYIRRRFPQLHLTRADMRLDLRIGLDLLKYGVPMGLQFSITAIGTVVLQAAVNGLGVMPVAAVAACGKLNNILTAPMDTLGVAMATYCGQNYGAKAYGRIRTGIRQSLITGFLLSVGMFALGLLLVEPLARLFINEAEMTAVMPLVRKMTLCNTACFPLLFPIFILRNSAQGLGYSGSAMLAGLFEMVARTAVAFLLVTRYGFDAVCVANPIAWVAADLLLIPLMIHIFGQIRIKQQLQAGAASISTE